jgi:hypothetical protein
MRTIGKHRPRNSPKGEYVTFCGICGSAWYRSKLFYDEQGILVCPDEGIGLDPLALERANMEMMTNWERSEHDAPQDPLNTDTAPDLAALTEAPTGGNFT